jgi:hypothetical protein
VGRGALKIAAKPRIKRARVRAVSNHGSAVRVPTPDSCLTLRPHFRPYTFEELVFCVLAAAAEFARTARLEVAPSHG